MRWPVNTDEADTSTKSTHLPFNVFVSYLSASITTDKSDTATIAIRQKQWCGHMKEGCENESCILFSHSGRARLEEIKVKFA